MQVVITVTPGHGHLYPTLPLAEALRAAGHAVHYALIDAPGLRQVLADRGFGLTPLPPTQAEQQARFARAWRDIAELSAEEADRQGLVRLFGPLVEPALDPLVDLLVEVRADLVVHELTAFAGPLAAARVGIPAVNQGTGFGFAASATYAGQALAGHWQAHGLEPAPLAGIYRHLHLEVFPPSMPNPILEVLDPARVVRARPLPLGASGAPPVAGPDTAGPSTGPTGRRPRVVVTLGTVFDDDPGAWPP